MRDGAVSRRALLAAALGLVAAGCGLRRAGAATTRSKGRPTASASGTSQAEGPLPFAVLNVPDPAGDPAKAVASLRAFDPKVDWLDYTGDGAGPTRSNAREYPPRWGVGTVHPFVPPSEYVSLLPALRRKNFDASRLLLPGTLRAFSDTRGNVYGLPLSVLPMGVVCNLTAFKAAGLAPPAADWTIDDFENACAALQGAAQAGRLPKGVYGALPPMGGRATIPVGRGAVLYWYGALSHPGLWGAFAQGFGGTVVREGHFDLTGTATVKGIGRLVDIARRYGGGAGMVPKTPAESAAMKQGAAMSFTSSPPPARVPATSYRLARFPKLPLLPVVPATPLGVGLVRAVGRLTTALAFPLASVPTAAEDAVVAYALWAYRTAQQHPQLATLAPPALADTALQTTYWATPARQTVGYDQVGDWRNMAVVESAWPSTGPAPGPVPRTRTADIMLTLLTQAVFENADVGSILSDATEQLNAAAAKYAASAAAHS